MKNSFILYADAYDSIRTLTDEECGQLLRAIFLYHCGEELPELTPVVGMAFSFLRRTFDANSSKYKYKCEKAKAAAKVRWDANACERIKRNAFDADTDTDTDTDSDTGTEKKKEKSFVEGSIELRLATFLFNCIRKNRPEFKQPDLQAWAKHVDLMLRIDKREPENVREVIKWAQADNVPRDGSGFCWAVNILSTLNLRKQFDQLAIKMSAQEAKTPDPSSVLTLEQKFAQARTQQ